MTTENPYAGLTQDDIDEAIQEAEDEYRHSQAEEVAQPVDPPVEDPFEKAARAIASPAEVVPDAVDKEYLDRQLEYLRNQVSADIASAVTQTQQPQAVEETPDVVALVNMLQSEDPSEPLTPEEVNAAKARFMAFRQQAETQKAEQSVPEILKEIGDKVSRLEERAAAPPVAQTGWSQQDENHVVQAINYAAVGTGIKIDYNDPVQMGAVMNGVVAGEPVESAIRKVHANIGQIGSRVNPAMAGIQPAPGASSIPSLDAIPTSQDEIVIRSEEEFHEAVADGKVSVADYPLYASQW